MGLLECLTDLGMQGRSARSFVAHRQMFQTKPSWSQHIETKSRIMYDPLPLWHTESHFVKMKIIVAWHAEHCLIK